MFYYSFDMKKLFWFYVYVLIIFASKTEAGDEDDLKPVATKTAQNGVVLDRAAQTNSGLKTVKLKSAVHRVEKLSYGLAVNIEPLLLAQNQYLNALAQQSSARAKTTFNQNNINRLSYLNKEGIVSNRTLQDQQATLQVEKAALESSHYLSQQIISNTRLAWGGVLTDWMIKSAPAFKNLIGQRSTLLKITFPADSPLNNSLKTILVASSNRREQAVLAQLISAAPSAESFSQGLQYFYQIPAGTQIKTGMRVSAWIPTQQQTQTGVIIPESALCWHLGQALVFIKVTEQQFSHRAIANFYKVEGGYFVSSAITTGEEIVSTGTQMLLSQEFKGQIPDEDND